MTKRVDGSTEAGMGVVIARYANAPGVDTQPVASLVRWSVFALPEGSRHFCGVHSGSPSEMGRVSSPIIAFDPVTRTGMTRSGRLYRLEGPPGADEGTDLIRRGWLARNGIDPSDVTPVDVSEMATGVN